MGKALVIKVWWNAVRHFYRPSLVILVKHIFWPLQREKLGWNMWNVVRQFFYMSILKANMSETWAWVKHVKCCETFFYKSILRANMGETWAKLVIDMLCDMLFQQNQKSPKEKRKNPFAQIHPSKLLTSCDCYDHPHQTDLQWRQTAVATLNSILNLNPPKISQTSCLKYGTTLAILCDLFGMVKWPFQGASDLQLGDEKFTLNHRDYVFQAFKFRIGKR